MTTRAEIVTEAREWIGTRYGHQCRLKGKRCDCIGLIGGVGVALGMASAIAWDRDPEAHNYGRQPNDPSLLQTITMYLDSIGLGAAGLGDILLLKWPSDLPHFAIIHELEPLRVIHGFHSGRRVSDTPIRGFWRQGVTWESLIVSAWRYKELAD